MLRVGFEVKIPVSEGRRLRGHCDRQSLSFQKLIRSEQARQPTHKRQTVYLYYTIRSITTSKRV
jgi:hypothetical protein